MFGLGYMEILLILVIVLILFGAGKLPKVMEDLGKGVKSFRQGMHEGKSEESSDKDKKNKDTKEF